MILEEKDEMISAGKESVADTEPVPHEGTFTKYVKALAECCRISPRGADEVPRLPPALFDDMWHELRQSLSRELRRRSMWSSPPSFVGVHGWESWSVTDTQGVTPPLDELLNDSYVWIFHQQLPRLLNQISNDHGIDGLVVFYLRNFLSERQRKHDPLGYRVFEILHTAVRDAVAVGDLHVIDGPPSIRNSTVLAVSRDSEPGDVAAVEQLKPLVDRWYNDLLPELVTAGGKTRLQVAARLQGYLFDLEVQGVAVFRFKDLIDLLKQGVRVRWQALLDHQDPRHTEDVAVTQDLVELFRFEQEEYFDKLVSCVAELIERLDVQNRTRRHLDNMWGFLRRYAFDSTERLPSYRKLSDLLKIPRSHFSNIVTTLRQAVLQCQGALVGSEPALQGKDATKPRWPEGGIDG